MTESEKLVAADEFERPIVTIDVVLFTLIDDHLHVLLPERTALEPAEFQGLRALVGGYIHTQEDEDTYAAARRVLRAKIEAVNPRWGAISHLEQLAVFSGVKRDPRGWTATVAYIGMVKATNLSKRQMADFHPVDKLPEYLAFDHKEIIGWAVKRIRDKTSYSTLPLFLMPASFTLSELQKVYEYLMGQTISVTTFRRKIEELAIIEPTGLMSDPQKDGVWQRPARLFRQVDQSLYLFDAAI